MGSEKTAANSLVVRMSNDVPIALSGSNAIAFSARISTRIVCALVAGGRQASTVHKMNANAAEVRSEKLNILIPSLGIRANARRKCLGGRMVQRTYIFRPEGAKFARHVADKVVMNVGLAFGCL